MKRNEIHLAILLTVLLAACGGSETPATSGAAASGGPTSQTPPTASAAPVPAPSAMNTEEMLAERLAGYEAPSLDGSTFRISDHKGKVVLVNAWATWCGPCRYEIPELKRLHQEYADDGLVIVGVSVDMGGAEPAVRQFVKVNAIGYPIVLDPQSRVTAMLRTTSIPTSVMIDRNGNVVWRHIGIVSEQRDAGFRDALASALGS